MKPELNRSLVLPCADLSAAQRDGMFRLMSGHFLGVTRSQFERDLAEKNCAILVMQGARLVGFSILLAYESAFEGQPVSVLYSGDTIMAREAWGSTVLARSWIATANALRQSHPRGPYYWLLLTSGFRTYRFLPVFWRAFWPRHDHTPDPAERRLLDHLASERFGEQYDPATGIVRFRQPQKLLPELAQVPVGRIANPHVACFLARNPGHARGDELVCLTSLSPDNLTAAGRRMLPAADHETASRAG
jgi:hypothetical protein